MIIVIRASIHELNRKLFNKPYSEEEALMFSPLTPGVAESEYQLSFPELVQVMESYGYTMHSTSVDGDRVTSIYIKRPAA